MVGGRRLRPFAVVALALVLTACSSGPGGGDTAAPQEERSTTTAVGAPDLHDDVVVDSQPGSTAAGPGSPATVTPGKTAARTGDGRDLPPPAGSTSTTTTATTTSTTLPPGLPAEKCPEPKSCRSYVFLTPDPYRWPTGPDGRATVEYWVNPTGATTMSIDDIEGAVAAAFASWERAAPTLRFVYRGRTDRLALDHDGVNVVAFDGDHNYAFVTQGEFDIHLRPGNWTWSPCEPRDGACAEEPGITFAELQSTATHEVGHVLWLGHPSDDRANAEMTMYTSLKRARQTLALGDVLGIRALYPCSCPLPPIYDP
jgi:hypothetical protein